MYKCEISGYYFEYGGLAERKYFNFKIEAPYKYVAMQIALGKIMLNAKNPVKLDVIQCECL